MKRICLIIDNPLRDFDGIVLIAAYLMMKNFEVFIVPMNAQNSDALSLNPDVVLVNYIRKNNLEILNLYKNRGIKVAILDTEGVGKWWPKHAQILRDMKADKVVDQYYCWGKEQHDHLVSSESLDHKKIKSLAVHVMILLFNHGEILCSQRAFPQDTFSLIRIFRSLTLFY